MSEDARPDHPLQAETTITEITVQPDGRVYVFGTSRQVLEVLDNLCPADAGLGRLLRHVREMEKTSVASAPIAAIDGGYPRAT